MQPITPHPAIVVYGAYGHTGRFIVAEMLRRGMRPILAGRDTEKLQALAAAERLAVRIAAMDDETALDRAFAGADAVIHAAGPFSTTAAPVIRSALRCGTGYLDIAAEPDIVEKTIAEFAPQAATAGIAFAPAMAFYGALGHLAAAAAMREWTQADAITLACALSSWVPTEGTRATIEAAETRRGGRRLRYADGRLQLSDTPAPRSRWPFATPLGVQDVIGEFATADSLTLARRFRVPRIEQYMALAPLQDLSASGEPEAVDALGRSAQTFVIEAEARRGDETRRASVRGQDIYAITAPLVVEAALRITRSPQRWRGLVTASDLGSARDFLRCLASHDLVLE